jgi:hypothetical protein
MIKSKTINNIISFLNQKEVKLLLLIGFLSRLILALLYLKVTKVPDSWSFMTLNEYLLSFDLEGYNGERSPGYPLLITLGLGTMKLTVVYQLILGILTTLFWYDTLIAFKFSQKHSFWITIFISSFLCHFFFETSILVETVTLFFISILFWMLAKNHFENSNGLVLSGLSLFFGYLVLIKPFFVFLPFLIYGLYVLKSFSWKTIINKKIVILIFPVLAYFGWSYVNKLNTNYFVSTTFLGLNTSQNCVYFAEKSPSEFDWISKPYVAYREKAIKENKDVSMAIWYAYNDSVFKKYHLPFPDFSNELGKFAKATIQKNKSDYLFQVFNRSFLDFWKVYDMKPYVTFDNSLVDSVITQIWTIQKNILQIFKLFFILIATYYLYESLRNRRISIEAIGVIIIFVTDLLQAFVTYGTNAKYSYPLEFIMIILVLLYFKNVVISNTLNTSAQ